MNVISLASNAALFRNPPVKKSRPGYAVTGFFWVVVARAQPGWAGNRGRIGYGGTTP